MTSDVIISKSKRALEAFQYLEKCDKFTTQEGRKLIDRTDLTGKISRRNFIHYFTRYGSKTDVKDVELMLLESNVVDSDDMVDYVKFVEHASKK